MSWWWAFVRGGYRRQAVYPWAAVAGAFTNTVFGLVSAGVLAAAVARHGGVVSGYDRVHAQAYIWVGQGALSTVAVFVWRDLALRVRSGDLAVDLLRPVDLQMSWLAADLGRAVFTLLPRGLPPLAFAVLVLGLRVPVGPAGLALGVVSLALAVVVSFAWRFLVSLCAFWTTEVRGILNLSSFVTVFLSGLSLPVAWFPDWLRALAACTPFPAMITSPVSVLIGVTPVAGAWRTLAVQLIWAAGLLLVGRLVLARGVRRVVVQGG